ncbi:hypothetical protein QJS04_geneDACA012496 [Acorus gramineus]|uniref:peptidylprolyl isomerase n=1 Tax=Acorus gramineus TaxID=55184 RepID=A0AAV9BDB5_ACOGR|nr:hypothetical protein QJS04_geneDACA012496 [Acorus gramineus]
MNTLPSTRQPLPPSLPRSPNTAHLRLHGSESPADGGTKKTRRGLCLSSSTTLLAFSAAIATSAPPFPASAAKGKKGKGGYYDEKRLLEQNRKIQEANNAPEDFPNFIREGFEVKVVTTEDYVTSNSGLIYLDIEVGKGDTPKDGQQVTFHYTGYNESGRRIDSTYLQGTPAKIRLGNKALVPGFEEGLRDMRPGGKRRMIIPPELGPPVGPSTFFSSRQFEVFDVEVLDVKSCERRTIVGFYSDVVCN